MTGEQLRELRERHAWSQDDLAASLNDALGRSYASSSISQWETGKRNVPKGVSTFLEALAIEEALPPPMTSPAAGGNPTPPGPPLEDAPPESGGPGAQPQPVLAGGTYARLCTELFEMLATGVSVVGAALGNQTLVIDGQIIDQDKHALGHAYGRLAETNETFRRMLTGAAGGGAWLEIAMVSASTCGRVMRNHLETQGGGGARNGQPVGPVPPTVDPDAAFVGTTYTE